MRILFAGSGTGGPVVPLLAVIEELRAQQGLTDVLFLGQTNGIEETLCTQYNVPFQAVPATKLRRYLSWKTLGIPFVLLKAFMQARYLIKTFKPDAFMSAGGFVAPPIAWACRSLNIPVVVHLQDSIPLLSDKLMRTSATRITVAWQTTFDQLPEMHKQKAVVTGNPYRHAFSESSAHTKDPNTIICMGGGGGARAMNERIWAIRSKLDLNIIHITGQQPWPEGLKKEETYTPITFTPDIAAQIHAAGIAVSRAGFSSMTELAVSQTPTILVPLPSSKAQMKNAHIAQTHGAAIMLPQDAPEEEWINTITRLATDTHQQERMKKAFLQLFPQDATQRVVKELLSTARGSVRS